MKKKSHLLFLNLGILLSGSLLAAEVEKKEQTALSDVLVMSDASEEKVKSYYNTKSASATRTDTPLLHTAQSVQIVTQEVLKDLSVDRLGDTIDYVSGISRQNNFGGTWDNFAIRGFSGHENSGLSLLKNGFSDNRGFNAPRDAANIESIEFLKGPSGSLYGNSEPGGTINIVSKKPKFISENKLDIKMGNEHLKRISADLTGPINESMAYRLNIMAEDKKSFRDYIESERYIVAPAFIWYLQDNTYLSYSGEYIRQEAPLDRGIIAVDGNVNKIDHKTFLGNPNDGDVTLQNYTHQLELKHDFSDDWSAKFGLAYKTGTFKGSDSEVSPSLLLTTDSVTLRTRHRDFEYEDIAFKADIQNTSTLAGFENTFLFGAEAYRYELDSKIHNLKNAVRVDNIYASPTYTTLLTGKGTLGTNTYEEQKGRALFVQDELSLSSSWKLLLGMRYDEVDMDRENHLNDTSSTQNDYALSPRIGLTYILNPRWSWYFTSGKSFRPNSGVDVNGNTFDAEEGLSYETGLKFESSDKRVGATLSLYNIEKENVLTGSDPSGTYSVAAGEVRSRGLEFDISGKVNDNIKVSFNYAYTDTEVTKDSGGAVDWATSEVVNLEGKALSNIPKHSAGLLFMWEDHFSNKSAYGIGTNVLYTGKREGNYINSFTLPSYVTAGIVSYWEVNDNLKFNFNINNLFDKEYIASSYDRGWLTPGTPRTYTLNMSYTF